MRWKGKRVDNLDTGDKSLAYANLPLGEWDPVETITQDRHEDILFENILFFIADHELANVSECRKTLHCKGGGPAPHLQHSGDGSVVGEEGRGWGASTG